MSKLTNTLLSLLEDDDTIDCPGCDNGKDKYGADCTYCSGVGLISEREYKDQINTETEDFNANN